MPRQTNKKSIIFPDGFKFGIDTGDGFEDVGILAGVQLAPSTGMTSPLMPETTSNFWTMQKIPRSLWLQCDMELESSVINKLMLDSLKRRMLFHRHRNRPEFAGTLNTLPLIVHLYD